MVPKELKESLLTPIYKKGDKLTSAITGLSVYCVLHPKYWKGQYTYSLNKT